MSIDFKTRRNSRSKIGKALAQFKVHCNRGNGTQHTQQTWVQPSDTPQHNTQPPSQPVSPPVDASALPSTKNYNAKDTHIQSTRTRNDRVLLGNNNYSEENSVLDNNYSVPHEEEDDSRSEDEDDEDPDSEHEEEESALMMAILRTTMTVS